MSSKSIRIMLTLDPDIQTAANELKKMVFYDRPKSEMYRYLIKLGLEVSKAEPMSIKASLEDGSIK